MKKQKVGKKMVIWVLIYVCCSALGLVMMKSGINKSASINCVNSVLEFKFGLNLFIGACLYVVSFLLSLFVMSKLNLSYFYPISAGLVYVLICFLSVFVLKEVLSRNAIIGMCLILAGVIFMNIPGKK